MTDSFGTHRQGRISGRYVLRPAAVGILLALIFAAGVSTPKALASPPPNDAYPGTTIAALPYSDSLNNTEAGHQPGELTSSCLFGEPIAATVWYNYTPAIDSVVIADTEDSDFDTVIAVWTPSEFAGGGFEEVACNDQAGNSNQSRVGFAAEGARTYYFQVGGFPFFMPTGNLVFRVNAGIAATNDDSANALAVAGLPFQDSTSTYAATLEPGEPEPFCAPLGATVWYVFTPGADTIVEVDTAGSDFDTVAGVWTGGPPAAWEEVACNDEFGLSSQARLAFAASAGVTYWVQVGSYAGFEVQPGLLEVAIKSYAMPDCPAPKFSMGDAMGDTFGVGPSFHDIVNMSAGDDAGHYCLTLNLDEAADTASPDPLDDLFGILAMDLDRNPATGFQQFIDGYCGAPSNLGVDAFATFGVHYGLLFPITSLGIFPFIPPPPVPAGAMLISGQSVNLILPVGAIGGDSEFNFGTVVGSFYEPTDCIPDSGFVRSTAGPDLMGDVDCSGAVDSVDALKVLRRSANLSVAQSEPCDDIGQLHTVIVGDVDCSGSVSSVDALKILRFAAGLSVAQMDPCPDIGTGPAGFQAVEDAGSASSHPGGRLERDFRRVIPWGMR